jgi:hypothetical protein
LKSRPVVIGPHVLSGRETPAPSFRSDDLCGRGRLAKLERGRSENIIVISGIFQDSDEKLSSMSTMIFNLMYFFHDMVETGRNRKSKPQTGCTPNANRAGVDFGFACGCSTDEQRNVLAGTPYVRRC